MSNNSVRTQSSEFDSKIKESSNEETFEEHDENSPFDDIDYIRASSPLIIRSLEEGSHIAQLPNGDIIVTEVKVVNSHYIYDREKQKMIKTSQN